ENMVSRGETLAEHLEWQLRMENLLEEELKFALDIIHSLNDEGYLTESIEEHLSRTNLHREDALEILKMIQNLDPVGCATSDLQDCLMVQAQALEERAPLVEMIIKKHMEELMRKDLKAIAKETGADIEKVKDAELVIMNFHPKPGRLISAEEPQYVVPDIFVKQVGDELVVHLND